MSQGIEERALKRHCGEPERASRSRLPGRWLRSPGAAEASTAERPVHVIRDSTIVLGQPHPVPLAEPSGLATAAAPRLAASDLPDLPERLVDEGVLSSVQLEVVTLATRNMERRVAGRTSARGGYLMGDGTGFGKGRAVAASILHFWRRGARRHVWLSSSPALVADVGRDLRDVSGGEVPNESAGHIPVLSLSDWPLEKPVEEDSTSEGVLFAPYSILSRDGRRVRQLFAWLQGVDGGVLVFDEAHCIRSDGSMIGQRMYVLQHKVPNCGVIYMSATVASRAEHFAFMPRLAIWGTPTSGFRNFQHFCEFVSWGGHPVMELLVLECKQRGLASNRMLTFEGLSFDTRTCETTPHFKACYDKACEFWAHIRSILEVLLESPDLRAGARATSLAWRMFWSAAQRFFRLMLTSGKVAGCAAAVQDTLRAGGAAVVSLWSTGDGAVASRGRPADGVALRGGPKSILEQLLGNTNVFRTRAARAREAVPWAESLLEVVLGQLAKLELPQNPLDELLDRLGGPDKVAEMSGRSQQVVRGRYRRREGGAGANQRERHAFQTGAKQVAVITEAGSVGFSLHADPLAEAAPRRRHMIVLELPFTAEKAVQALGRVHRAGQSVAPHYSVLISDLQAEMRFVAGVAKRMAGLGAISKGCSMSFSHGAFESFDLNHGLARQAITRFLNAAQRAAPEKRASQRARSDHDSDSTVSGIGDDQGGESDVSTTSNQDALDYVADDGITPEDPPDGAAVARSTDAEVLREAFLRESSHEEGVDCGEDVARFAAQSLDALAAVGIAKTNGMWLAFDEEDGLGDCSSVNTFLNRMLLIPCNLQNLILGTIMHVCESLVGDAPSATHKGIVSLNMPPLLHSVGAPPRPVRVLESFLVETGLGQCPHLTVTRLSVDEELTWPQALSISEASPSAMFVRPKRRAGAAAAAAPCFLCVPRGPRSFAALCPCGEPRAWSRTAVGRLEACSTEEASRLWSEGLGGAPPGGRPVTLLCGDILALGFRLRHPLFLGGGAQQRAMFRRASTEDGCIIGVVVPPQCTAKDITEALCRDLGGDCARDDSSDDGSWSFATEAGSEAGGEAPARSSSSGSRSSKSASKSSSSSSSSSSS